MTKPTYGGQAVIEGVMMAGPAGKAIAVRNGSGEIIYKIEAKKQPSARMQALKWPLIRGVVGFWQAMVGGMKDLTWSAAQAGESEDDKLSVWEIISAVVTALIFAVGIFIVIPVFAATALHPYVGDFGRSLLEGLLRAFLFIGYILLISRMNDIKRVFACHGAEHKTINAFEQGAELTPQSVAGFSRIHTRCGTSFVMMAMLLMIIIFTFVGQTAPLQRILIKLLLMPLIAGLAYELFRLPLKFPRSKIVKALVAPGLLLQRLTTREPDLEQLEVAISALKAVPGFAEDAGEVETAEAAEAAEDAEDAAPVALPSEPENAFDALVKRHVGVEPQAEQVVEEIVEEIVEEAVAEMAEEAVAEVVEEAVEEVVEEAVAEVVEEVAEEIVEEVVAEEAAIKAPAMAKSKRQRKKRSKAAAKKQAEAAADVAADIADVAADVAAIEEIAPAEQTALMIEPVAADEAATEAAIEAAIEAATEAASEERKKQALGTGLFEKITALRDQKLSALLDDVKTRARGASQAVAEQLSSLRDRDKHEPISPEQAAPEQAAPELEASEQDTPEQAAPELEASEQDAPEPDMIDEVLTSIAASPIPSAEKQPPPKQENAMPEIIKRAASGMKTNAIAAADKAKTALQTKAMPAVLAAAQKLRAGLAASADKPGESISENEAESINEIISESAAENANESISETEAEIANESISESDSDNNI